jgi:hypothetical protein
MKKKPNLEIREKPFFAVFLQCFFTIRNINIDAVLILRCKSEKT